MDVFARKSLDAHNRYRAMHNVPPLTWSNSIAREAQKWANKLAKEGKLIHDKSRSGQGENVFMSSGANFDDAGEAACESWYQEVERYNFQRGGHQSGTGHFTQVVWKSSEELGVARAKSKKGAVFVVARYSPGGNDLNAFNENILPKVSNGVKNGAYEKEVTKKSEAIKQPEVKQPEKEANSDSKQEPMKAIVGMGPVRMDIKTLGALPVDEDTRSRILDIHNNYRAMHNAAPLRWSAALAKDAQAWAGKLAREGRLEHASREDRYYKGENICRMSHHFDIGDALQIWYNESESYQYDNPGFALTTGHFTQIVWRGTREVGVGFAKSPDGRLTYAVARYNPPGNNMRHFKENVLPMKVH
ncbi:predicted protein [Nematostella vectensis]|uniref:SCP domain-containing protein n=1 Tax=Nematostella vectensis TaxID=45351 RepID=A7RH92_NEMVE|nr:predicted protein [Nematostella vectensis]|eukprot:XP_001641373.1 predicted protein [Nematostella vectensis]